MRLKLVPYILAACGLLIAGYGIWRRNADPPRVIETGTLKITDPSGTVMIFPKRRVVVAGFETTEAQLPGGSWIDCRGDCAEAIRIETSNIWDSSRLRGR